MSSTILVEFPQNYMVRNCNSTNSLIDIFWWKTRFKNQATTCADYPSEAMPWIKEVEMVESLDELKFSRSVSGKIFPIFEMLDAKTASALNKITQNYSFNEKKRANRKPRSRIGLHEEDKSPS